MIPKVIHYCWFGGNPMPELVQKCIESWKKYCPDYEIKLWNESNFNIDSCCDYVKEAYANKRWAFVSDYVRIAIVYKYGGIYLDTDVELLKNLDDLLENDAFMGIEPPNFNVNTGIGFGAIKGHKFLERLLEKYDDTKFIMADGSMNLTTCVEHTMPLLILLGYQLENKIQYVDNIKIFPPEYFCPVNWLNGKTQITEKTYSIHHYQYSWSDETEKRYHKVEQAMRRRFGNTLGGNIARIYRVADRCIDKLKKGGIKEVVKYLKDRK